jgi:hypothetical protein
MDTKVIVCDLDGTLTESKADLQPDVAEVIDLVLQKHKLAVISGASYAQFQKQFLSHLSAKTELLKNLYLFPTNGSACFGYNLEVNDWKKIYEETLTEEEKSQISEAFSKAILESGINVSNPYGQLIEDRGGQITFSGCGQMAPLEVKQVWDSDQQKRKKIVEVMQKIIPQFEIKIGGATSIDVTRKGVTKAYAISKIDQILSVKKEDIIFLGDALFPGGNDESVRDDGVQCIAVSGPNDSKTILLSLI